MRHKTRWPLWQLQSFITELSQLLSAGLPLFLALDLLHSNLTQQHQIMLAKQLQQKIAQGISFATAWQQITQENLSSTLLLAGEKSGLLIDMLNHIETYAKAQQEFRQLIWQALRYPIFLLLLTVVLLTLLCTWVVPQFAMLYNSFNAPMPMLTKVIIQICTQTQQHLWHAIAIIGFSLLFLFCARHHRACHFLLIKIKHRFAFFRQHQELQFWHATTLLLQAGIPLSQALEICKQVLEDSTIRQQINFLISQLRQGEKLSSTLKQINCFSAKLIAVLALAEASGQLALMLSVYLASQIVQMRLQVQTLKTWLEPIFLCGIGLVIGTVLIALYLPIVELGKWV